jgi:hypothetical protein
MCDRQDCANEGTHIPVLVAFPKKGAKVRPVMMELGLKVCPECQPDVTPSDFVTPDLLKLMSMQLRWADSGEVDPDAIRVQWKPIEKSVLMRQKQLREQMQESAEGGEEG